MILTYDQKYEEELLHLWNRCMTADPITARGFRQQVLFDDNFDSQLCYLYFREEQLAGFLLATKRKFPYLERGTEPDRGWINLMFVEPRARRQGIGTELVLRAEADLKARGQRILPWRPIPPAIFSPVWIWKPMPVRCPSLKRWAMEPQRKAGPCAKTSMDMKSAPKPG